MKLATHDGDNTLVLETFAAWNLGMLNGGICLTTMGLSRGTRRVDRICCWPGFCCLPIVNTNLFTYHHPVGYKGYKYCLVLLPFSNLEMYSISRSSQLLVVFCLYDNDEISLSFHKLEARFLFHSSIVERE